MHNIPVVIAQVENRWVSFSTICSCSCFSPRSSFSTQRSTLCSYAILLIPHAPLNNNASIKLDQHLQPCNQDCRSAPPCPTHTKKSVHHDPHRDNAQQETQLTLPEILADFLIDFLILVWNPIIRTVRPVLELLVVLLHVF